MAKKIILDLDIDSGNSVRNMQQLETELEQLRDEIKGVEIGSDAFNELAVQIQRASSEVKTLDKNMEGLEPQQKTEAFLKMGEGIAGGFAMAQGAMGLMGSESEHLQEVQTRVQSAISIAMGARMVSEGLLMATTAKRVIQERLATLATSKSIIVQKAATVAAKAFNLVMASNPLGLVLRAVAALVAGFVIFRKSSERTRVLVSNGFKSMANAIIRGTNAVIDAMNKINPFKAIERIKEFEKEVVPAFVSAKDKAEEVDTTVKDIGKSADETKKKLLELAIVMDRFAADESLDPLKKRNELQTKQFEEDIKRGEESLEFEQFLMDRKIGMATDTFSSLSNLASLFEGGNEKRAKKAFQLTKALNLAQAIMDTYAAANAVLKDPTYIGFARFAAAAAAITTGLANVATIAKTKFEGGGSGSIPTSGSSLDTIAAATPASFGATGGTSSADIASAISGQNQTPIKAFVVAQEVTDMQQINEELQIQSSL